LFNTFKPFNRYAPFKLFAASRELRGARGDGLIITSHARNLQQLEVAVRENMVFIFKPSVRSGDGNSVSTLGDTVVITANGDLRLEKRAHDLAISPAN
jgi:hypothetical protein